MYPCNFFSLGGGASIGKEVKSYYFRNNLQRLAEIFFFGLKNEKKSEKKDKKDTVSLGNSRSFS